MLVVSPSGVGEGGCIADLGPTKDVWDEKSLYLPIHVYLRALHIKEIYKNLECSLDITLLEATAVKGTFLGSDSTTGKKNIQVIFLRAVRKFFCVALIGMAQRTSFL